MVAEILVQQNNVKAQYTHVIFDIDGLLLGSFSVGSFESKSQ